MWLALTELEGTGTQNGEQEQSPKEQVGLHLLQGYRSSSSSSSLVMQWTEVTEAAERLHANETGGSLKGYSVWLS